MILTIGPGGCGFTFLNWSISFLRGDISYKTLDGTFVPVDINPINGNTAHRFQKDHLIVRYSNINFNSATEQSIIYLVPFDKLSFDSVLTLPGKKIVFDNRVYKLEWLVRAYTCIPNNPYAELINKLSVTYNINDVKQVVHDSVKFFIGYYQIPDDQYTLNYNDIFLNLDNKILEVLNFVDVSVDQDRLTKWKPIYDQYRASNYKLTQQIDATISNGSSATKLKILKEIIQWKNGLYQDTCNS
jgi:hypothetical protein